MHVHCAIILIVCFWLICSSVWTKLINTFSQAWIYGYLNSTIIFVMVTAAINANLGQGKHWSTPKSKKKLRANRGKTMVPGSILSCMNQTIECICVLLLWLWKDLRSWLVQCPSLWGDVCCGQVNWSEVLMVPQSSHFQCNSDVLPV